MPERSSGGGLKEEEILESWKEISSYLRRSVRTCRRWEEELRLPIHRIDGTPRARVFAYRGELERWMEEKLNSSEAALEARGEPARPRSRKAIVVAAAVTAFAAVGVLAWQVILRKSLPTQPSKKQIQAVLPEPGKIVQDQDREIDLGPITSRRPEALKSYVEGCRILLGRFDLELGRRAGSHFNKALEIDPEFAMAYRALGSIGSKEDRERNLRKALELSDRVSPRERLMIQGAYYSVVEGNFEKAIQAYKKALRIHPDDEMANAEIAILFGNIRDFENAFKHREFLYERNRTSSFQVAQYARACRQLGFHDKAIEAYRYYLDRAPEDTEMRSGLYDTYWMAGMFEPALREADRLKEAGKRVDTIYPLYLMGDYEAAEQLCQDIAKRATFESVWGARDWLRNIYLTQGRLGKAKEQVVLGLREEEELAKSGTPANVHGRCLLPLRLAELFMIEGKLEDAMNEVEKAWAVIVSIKRPSYIDAALMTKARILLRMKLYDKAREIAERIHELKNPPAPKEAYLLISGEIELERGNASKAIDLFDQARSEYLLRSGPSGQDLVDPDITFALASAYCRAGKLRSARRESEKIPALSIARGLKGYTYAMNFFLLGEICERQGDRVKAIEYYGKFRGLWKDADSVFPEVEKATTKLARLTSD